MDKIKNKNHTNGSLTGERANIIGNPYAEITIPDVKNKATSLKVVDCEVDSSL